MKITALYVYPIKGLRGVELKSARVGPQGINHDRRFMLYEVRPTGELKKMQVDSHPRCALFEQQMLQRPDEGRAVVAVRYHGELPGASGGGTEEGTLEVPLEPDIKSLAKIDVNLHRSPTTAYRMGDTYDAWFSQRFGFPTILVYIGDGRRAVLGKTLPPKPNDGLERHQQRGWMASLASYFTGAQTSDETSTPWLTFSDVAPLLVTSESSLRDVNTRLLNGQSVPMYKFRPNIVVDGEGEDAWAEDFWAELAVGAGDAGTENGAVARKQTLLLTGNCVRCTSLNVDYQTGKPAEGELGTVLKKLMKDRRVDQGAKWSPVFGRYAFLPTSSQDEGFTVAVGDSVEVTRRNTERSVWDWPGL
ncbi:hypothetical protein VTK56DRAFT_7905 [Thermocarpiscus australiensis]